MTQTDQTHFLRIITVVTISLILSHALGFITAPLFVSLCILFMLVLLIKDILSPEINLFACLVTIMIGSELSPKPFIGSKECLHGFSDPIIITIAALFIVARGIRLVGLIDIIAKKALDGVTESSKAIKRISFPLIFLSSFLNNTPIVAIFMPVLRKWGLNHNIAPSKLLIPLSYLTIFGGICTQLGTSTNLMLKGMADEAGVNSFGLVELAWVGLPASIIGTLYLVFFSKKLLPEHKDILEEAPGVLSKHLLELQVIPNSPLSGKSIHDAGLRNLDKLFLFEVRRDDHVIAPVKSNFILEEKDILVFSGDISHLNTMTKKEGLEIVRRKPHLAIPQDSVLLEVVIAPTSSLRGRSLKQVFFNRTYNAMVLSLQRSGESYHKKFNTEPLKTGDTLLILAGKGFRKVWQNSNDFLFVTPNREDLFNKKQAIPVVVLSLLMILLPLLGIMSILQTSCLTALAFIWLKIIDAKHILRNIDWSVLIVIACSFGLSQALVQSGAASILSQQFITSSSMIGLIGLLILIYICTNILTEVISNNAAAALLFPIALECASKLEISPTPLIITIAIAASASFATPIGYQTNTIVYGPGRYRYSDYLKIGLPLNILYLITSAILIPTIWKF